MTIDNSSPYALKVSENYQKIQTAILINLKAEISKGIKDVKSGHVKKMDIHAKNKRLVHCTNELPPAH